MEKRRRVCREKQNKDLSVEGCKGLKKIKGTGQNLFTRSEIHQALDLI